MVRKTSEIKLTDWIKASNQLIDTDKIFLNSSREELTEYQNFINNLRLKN